MRCQKRVKVLGAPTGFGKSPLAVGFAVWSKKATAIVTESRALQDYYGETYGSMGLVILKGRSNYDCTLRGTCEDGYASNCPFHGTASCPSSAAEFRAATSWLVVFNYDKWTASKKFGTGFEHIQQVIFDEGHSAPDALARAMQVQLHRKEIEETLRLEFLAGSESDEMTCWKEWARGAKDAAQEEMNTASLLAKGSNPKAAHVKHFLHMRNLVRRLGLITTSTPESWVVDTFTGKRGDTGFQFDPLREGRYTESGLFFKIPSVILMSATITPKTLFRLNQSRESFDYKEFDSDFPKERCPIYHIPTMRVNHSAVDLRPIWLRMDQVGGRRKDRKGLVQTVNYQRQQEILQVSNLRAKMLFNNRGEPANDTLHAYRTAGPGTILVSPSFSTGYDFPGSQCEWQFLVKVPFPDTRSKILAARKEQDNDYDMHIAMMKLVQMVGRAMRYRQDACENFIGDDSIVWFLRQYGYLAPKWFNRFYKSITVLPPPPPKLTA